MNVISLLILAAVAGFLFYQLRSVLGQTPYDKKTLKKKNGFGENLLERFNPQKDNLVDITKSSDYNMNNFIKKSDDINQDDVIKTLNAIKLRYDNFDILKFIEGAKKVYDIIIESFNKNLPEETKSYMSTEIYDNYRKSLDDYAEKKYTFQTIVTRIDKAVIVSAQTNEVSAKITVEINAYNISSLKDESGNIIQGNPDNVVAVTDVWVFERHYSANNSAWTVVAIA